jgi:hypothetical protein
MSQIDFAEAFAEEIAEPVAHRALTSAPDFHFCEETGVFIEPSRFRTNRLGRSEWANILFAGITIAGGLFCAFYFFNGADLVRAALAWPGEYLYPRPVPSAQNIALHNSALPDEAPLPVTIPERRSVKTDPTGDPFPRVNKLLTLDRSLGSLPRSGGGLTAGLPPPLLPPPVSGPPVPPGVPGVPSGPVGGLPGPGTLISRLTLLIPGGDSLTQSLQKTAATMPANIIVTLRHETARVQTATRRAVKRVVVVRRSSVAANTRGTAADRVKNTAQSATGPAQTQQGISNGLGAAGNAQDRMNAGTGAVSIGSGAGTLGGGVGGITGAAGGTLGGIGGGLRGTIGGTVGAVGGTLGGQGGGGGLLGGGGHH